MNSAVGLMQSVTVLIGACLVILEWYYYNISDKVKFLGKIKLIENLLSISDVFLLPSETESFGLVALEAMASKTAVISTNSGGLPEVNKDGFTGFLSDVGDVKKMSKDLSSLLSNSQLLNEMKRRKQKFGAVTMCVGTGQGACGIFELL